jgi:hypothetical protein
VSYLSCNYLLLLISSKFSMLWEGSHQDRGSGGGPLTRDSPIHFNGPHTPRCKSARGVLGQGTSADDGPDMAVPGDAHKLVGRFARAPTFHQMNSLEGPVCLFGRGLFPTKTRVPAPRSNPKAADHILFHWHVTGPMMYLPDSRTPSRNRFAPTLASGTPNFHDPTNTRSVSRLGVASLILHPCQKNGLPGSARRARNLLSAHNW